MTDFVFDPRILIQPPFRECPKCKSLSYGVLSVHDHHYMRRCKVCRQTDCYSLPPIEKKVIYIDQFAISNMMMSINPNTKAHQRGRVDEVWLKLFERLHTLCQLQVIICPDSHMHSQESMTSPFSRALRRMYETLSHGVTFTDPDTIRRFQIQDHAKWWVLGREEPYKPDFSGSWVLSSSVDVWQERFVMSVEWPERPEWIENVRQSRQAAEGSIAELFEHWQSETGKDFGYWYQKELEGFRSAMLAQYRSYFTEAIRLGLGLREYREGDLFPPVSVVLIRSLHELFERHGVSQGDLWEKTHEYFEAEIQDPVPFSRISAMLWAAIARKAASGQRRLPSRGTVVDIDVISTLLPYCDAMLLDKECETFLKEEPLRSQIGYGTRVFSLNSISDFFSYLDDLRQGVSDDHMCLVREVYGEGWEEPYTSMYEQEGRDA